MQKENSKQNGQTPGVVRLKIYFSRADILEIENFTFFEAMKLVWTGPAFKDHNPLKLKFSTGKILYMDKAAFNSFLEKELSLEELIKKTECDELYRNKIELFSESVAVDPGHLWMLKGKTLFLVDDDADISTALDLVKFEIA